MTWYDEKHLEILRKQGAIIGQHVKIDESIQSNCKSLEIGDYSQIDAFTFLSGKIKIGKFTEIGVHCILSGSEGITIGDACAISPFGYLFTNSANFHNQSLSLPTIPEKYKRKSDKGKIIIDNHVIIGARGTVFPKTIIGSGAKFGVGSIIKGIFKGWSLYVTNGCEVAVFREALPSNEIETDYKKLLADLYS